jgi:hypothetical protein
MTEFVPETASAFIKGLGDAEFRPFAYYDKHLDCIRVQVLDCSFKEDRKNRIITVLTANHSEQDSFAGFNIKGVRYLFEQLKLPATGIYKMTELIDKMVQFFPDAAIKQVRETFRPILRDEDLSVELG